MIENLRHTCLFLFNIAYTIAQVKASSHLGLDATQVSASISAFEAAYCDENKLPLSTEVIRLQNSVSTIRNSISMLRIVKTTHAFIGASPLGFCDSEKLIDSPQF